MIKIKSQEMVAQALAPLKHTLSVLVSHQSVPIMAQSSVEMVKSVKLKPAMMETQRMVMDVQTYV